MGDLYRSRSMSYVRLLIAEESSYDTIRHLGDWGQLMVVDLSAAATASTLSNSSSSGQLSERITRLKKRIGSCQYWEKRLDMLRDVMAEHGVELRAMADGARVGEDIRQADVLEAAAAYIEPLDAAISSNIHFKREQTHNIDSMTERMLVLDAVVHPDNQSDLQRRQRMERGEADGSAHST